MNYYNEFDPQAAQWLRNLIAAGLIPAGDVDERSIEDVIPNELRGYTQCHFFAGIGGWSLALDLAGWPRDRPVWTGSCPCQPFSAAGKGDGFADERHLWPAFQHIIAQCRPSIVFGEQVASKATDAWVDLVHADLENMGYAFGCVPFSAASIGAPHIRDRNYWVANAELHGRFTGAFGGSTGSRKDDRRVQQHQGRCAARGLANPDGRNASAEREQCSGEQRQQPQDGGVVGMADADSRKRDGLAIVEWNERIGDDAGRSQECGKPQSLGDLRRLADADIIAGRQGGQVNGGRDSRGDAESRAGSCGGFVPSWTSPLHGFWRDADWLKCRDGKWRPVEPGTFPLAHGIPARVVRLRAYGNSIVPQAAAAFVGAYMASESAVELAA